MKLADDGICPLCGKEPEGGYLAHSGGICWDTSKHKWTAGIGSVLVAKGDATTRDNIPCPRCVDSDIYTFSPNVDAGYRPKSYVKLCSKCGAPIPSEAVECMYCETPQFNKKKS